MGDVWFTRLLTDILNAFPTIILVVPSSSIGNGCTITWILHQIIMFSNKVKLVAG